MAHIGQIRSHDEYREASRQSKKMYEMKMSDTLEEWTDYDERELDRLERLLQMYELLHPEVLPHQHIEMEPVNTEAPAPKWQGPDYGEEWPATEAAHQRIVERISEAEPNRRFQALGKAIADLENENKRLLGKNDRLQRKVELMETARQQHFAERNELQNDNARQYRELGRWRRGELVHDDHKLKIADLNKEIDSLRHSASNYQELYEQRAESLEKAEAELANLRDAVAGWKVSNEQFHAKNEQLRAEIDRLFGEKEQFRAEANRLSKVAHDKDNEIVRLRNEIMGQHGIVRNGDNSAPEVEAERLRMDLRKTREGRDKIAENNKVLRRELASTVEENKRLRDKLSTKTPFSTFEEDQLREQLQASEELRLLTEQKLAVTQRELNEWESVREVLVGLHSAVRKAGELLDQRPVPVDSPEPDWDWVKQGFRKPLDHQPGGGINT